TWTKEEDALLMEVVQVLGEQSWEQVSYCFEDRTAVQCMHHWTKCLNPSIRRGRWQKDEDGALRAALAVYGENRWIKIQQHVPGRTDVQCRERYMNVLAPSIKSGAWTPEEVERLLDLVKIHGEGKWALIASKMDGRTDNQCARRYRHACRENNYWSANRRKGRTTISQLPDTEEDMAVIRRLAEQIRRKKRFDEHLQRQMDLEKIKIVRQQDATMQLDYEQFLEGQCYIYNMWNTLWGQYLDPIEHVFNIGIPVMSSTQLMKNHMDEPEPDFNYTSRNKVPDPASVLRPGKVRPVPPCLATIDAFSRLIQQGEHSDYRFRLKHVRETKATKIYPLKTLPLSVEEQRSPEYIELAERFEAVFMWPMLVGMLHMDTAKKTVDALTGGNKKRKQGV
ncbi:Myblike DNAbinding domain-containing protein, partial [Lobosporangium transversale]